MATRGIIRLKDWGGEPTSVTFFLQDVGAANFATVTQDLDEIKDACLAFLGGSVESAGFSKDYPEAPNTADGIEAQREKKWVLSYRDDTQFLGAGSTFPNPGYRRVFEIEFGTALLTDGTDDFLMPGTDIADMSVTAVSDFVNAILPNIRSPYNHQSAVTPTNTYIQMRYVGRNS